MARRVFLFLLPLGLVVSAFTTGTNYYFSRARNVTPLWMGGGAGFATSLDGKKKTVEKIKGLLDSSQMIFTAPAGSLTVTQTQNLRRKMPDGTTVVVVKNKLMSRAVEGTEYEAASNMLKGANMWFFIEEDIGGTIKAYKDYTKDIGKKETHPILGGVIEGNSYDSDGVEVIGNLPSKQDLYAKIAGSIKAVPTMVARVIKAPGNKLARAIKLATMPEPKD